MFLIELKYFININFIFEFANITKLIKHFNYLLIKIAVILQIFTFAHQELQIANSYF